MAHKPHKDNRRAHHRPDATALDPMTDIKRRERFLLKEKTRREMELQREYEQRL